MENVSYIFKDKACCWHSKMPSIKNGGFDSMTFDISTHERYSRRKLPVIAKTE